MIKDHSGLPEGEPVEVLHLEGAPIKAFGEEILELRFMRRIKASDMIYLEELDLKGSASDVAMLQRLTGIPSASLREMDAYDLNKAAGILAGFLLRGPRIGDKS